MVVVALGRKHGRLVGVHLVLFLVLHPSVLEPDLDLALGQLQPMSYLDSSSSGQIFTVVELFLELQSLVPSVGLSSSLASRASFRFLHPRINLAICGSGFNLVHSALLLIRSLANTAVDNYI